MRNFSGFSAAASAEEAYEIYSALLGEGWGIDRKCYDSVCSILNIK